LGGIAIAVNASIVTESTVRPVRKWNSKFSRRVKLMKCSRCDTPLVADESHDDLIKQMSDARQLAENVQNTNKFLILLKQTFDHRRSVIHKCTATSAIKSMYPALFSREGIIEEYEMITSCAYSSLVAHKSFIHKAPRLVDVAELMLAQLKMASTKKTVNKREACLFKEY
jgi:hypothetical protein